MQPWRRGHPEDPHVQRVQQRDEDSRNEVSLLGARDR